MLLTFEIARKIQVNINFVDEILYSVYGIVASLFIIKKYGRPREKKNYVGNYFSFLILLIYTLRHFCLFSLYCFKYRHYDQHNAVEIDRFFLIKSYIRRIELQFHFTQSLDLTFLISSLISVLFKAFLPAR